MHAAQCMTYRKSSCVRVDKGMKNVLLYDLVAMNQVAWAMPLVGLGIDQIHSLHL